MSLPEIAPKMISLDMNTLIQRIQCVNHDAGRPSTVVLEGPATRALERNHSLAFRKRMHADNHEARSPKRMRLCEPRSPILHHWNNIFNALGMTDIDSAAEAFPIIDSNWEDDDAVDDADSEALISKEEGAKKFFTGLREADEYASLLVTLDVNVALHQEQHSVGSPHRTISPLFPGTEQNCGTGPKTSLQRRLSKASFLESEYRTEFT